MNDTVYVVWSKRDGREDIQSIHEDLEDAKQAVDDNVPRRVFGDDIKEIERGVYSQYGYLELEFGWWVTEEKINRGDEQ